MSSNHSRPTIPKTQRGAALLIMIVIMVVGIAAMLVTSLSTSALNNARREKTSEALAQAKAALIGYAATYGDTHPGEVHGYLPCPDDDAGNPEGSAEAGCGLKDVNQIGRLPWRTLGLSPLRDGYGECLWYAVSGNYKSNPKTDLMNWDTNGQMQVFAADGTTRLDSNADQVVAVVFAPNAALSGQDRSGASAPICGGNYTPANYLDDDASHLINNANTGVGHFRQGTIAPDVNDQFIYITKDELWEAIGKRTDFYSTLNLMTRLVAECLADYGVNNANHHNRSMPWPAPVDLLASANYAVNSKYDDNPSSFSGRVPFRVDDSKSTSNNDMHGDFLMYDGNNLACPAPGSADPDLKRIYPWWNNWKDQLFYAIANEYQPSNSVTNPCGSCLTINGAGNYAAVVMFSGKKLSGHSRLDKKVVADYLELGNNANVAATAPPTNGDEDYVAGAANSAFNDVLYCIDTDLSLSVHLCP